MKFKKFLFLFCGLTATLFFALFSCQSAPLNGPGTGEITLDSTETASETQKTPDTAASFSTKPLNSDSTVPEPVTEEQISDDPKEAAMYNKFLTDGPDTADRYLTGSTKKNPLSYEIGETITFHISLATGKSLTPCWRFAYTIAAENGKKENGTVDGSQGWFEVSTILDEPGSVQVTADAYDNDGNVIASYTGGAAAAAKEIRLVKEEPADFDAFWAEQIKRLDDLGLEVLKYEMIKENASFYIYDVRLNAIGNMPVSGYLSIPKNAKPGKCIAKLSFQGYSCEGSSMFFEKNTILFSVNIHGLENGMDASYYQEMARTVADGFGFSTDRIGDKNTSDYLYLHLRNLQAVRFVKSFEEWNGKDLIVTGGSCGAMQAIALAALDKDISQVSAWIPWLCDVGGYTGGRIKSTFAPSYVDAMGYFDTVSFARRVTCQVGIMAGLGDKVIPLSGVLALINGFRENAVITGLAFRQHDTHGYEPPVLIEYNYDSLP